MASSPMKISLMLKLLFFATLLFIAYTTISATNNIPLLHKPPIRKMAVGYRKGEKAVVVPKVYKPTSADFPWGGGYVRRPPILNNP
uniref:Transmembrane protein n=1 Tax=Cucumis sativus TaxID=3659 RepID=A0A0A0L8B2_CUCSA